MSSGGNHISVAIVTRNGPHRLEQCLESLHKQRRRPFEVLISDDSSAEHIEATKKVAHQFGAVYVPGPRRGLYANRNRAAAACSGTHIRTMDDDHTFPDGHWDACEAAVANDPKAFWTVGERCLIDGRPWVFLENANQLHPSGVGCDPPEKKNNWAVADGATIYPAEIFQLGHRMVEEFGYGSSYLEFGAYIYKRGFIGKCIQGAYVEHHARPETMQREGIDVVSSRLFASLAYNLYFKKSNVLTIKYCLSFLVQAKMDPTLVLRGPQIFKSVRHRWFRN